MGGPSRQGQGQGQGRDWGARGGGNGIRDIQRQQQHMVQAAALDSAGVSGKFNTQPLLSLLRASDEKVVDSLLEECFAHRRSATLPAAKATEVQRQLRLESDQEVAALHHAVCQLVWHVTEAPNAPSNLFIKKEVAVLFPEGFHEDLKALLVDVVAKKVPPWKQEIQGGGKPGQQPKKDGKGKKSATKFRPLDAGPRSSKGIKQAKEAVLAEAATDAPGQAPHEGAAGDKAAMLRWLERREAEA